MSKVAGFLSEYISCLIWYKLLLRRGILPGLKLQQCTYTSLCEVNTAMEVSWTILYLAACSLQLLFCKEKSVRFVIAYFVPTLHNAWICSRKGKHKVYGSWRQYFWNKILFALIATPEMLRRRTDRERAGLGCWLVTLNKSIVLDFPYPSSAEARQSFIILIKLNCYRNS